MKRTFTQLASIFWVMLLILVFSGGSINAQSLPFTEDFENGTTNFNLTTLDPATTGTKSFGIATSGTGQNKLNELEIQADPGKASNVSYSGLFSLKSTLPFRKGYYYTLTVRAKAGANLGGGASGSTTTSGRLRFVKGTSIADLSTATGSYLISDQTVSGTTYANFTAYLKSSDLAADANLLVGLRLDGFTTSADANKATLTLDDFTVTENTCPTISAPVATTPSVTRCGTGNVTLSVNTNPNPQIVNRWFSNGSLVYTGDTYNLTLSDTNLKTFTVEAYNTVTGCVSTDKTTITAKANALPVASVTVNGPSSYCPATTASRTNLSVGTSSGNSYQWYKDGAAISGATIFNYTPTVSGQYYVVVTNSSGCSAQSSSYTIDVQTIQTSNGSIDLLGGGDYVEPGKPATYVVTSEMQTRGDAQSYRWYMISDAGTTVLSSTTDQQYIASVPDYQFTLRCEITPKSGSCYDPTPLRIETTQITPLPVEIIYFNAAKQGNNVLLEWATASEKNNTGFEVQVSEDGFNFRKLGFVATKNGNTVLKQTYTYNDIENGKYGTRYYRLKQLDMDGKFEYFTTKAVSFGQVSSYSLKAFPNPFESEVSLEINAEQAGKLNVQVVDAMGKSVLVEQFAVSKGRSNEKIVIWQSLPKGIYFVRTEMNGIANNFKLLKK